MIDVSHRISHGIVDTAIDERCNFVIIGRQKQPSFLDRVFSSLIDTVLQKSPSEAAVLHGSLKADRVRNIHIPFAANAHTRLAMEIAPALADYFGATVHVVVILEPGTAEHERTKREEEIRKLMGELSLEATVTMVPDRDLVSGIVRSVRGSDLIVMGGRTGDYFELLLANSLSQSITERVECPVLWVTEYEERVSFWASLFRAQQKIGEPHA